MLNNIELEKLKTKIMMISKEITNFYSSSELNAFIYKIIYINYYLRKNQLLKITENEIFNSMDDYINSLEIKDNLFQEVISSLDKKINNKNFNLAMEKLNNLSMDTLKQLTQMDYETSIYNMSTPSDINCLVQKILETTKGEKILDICSCYGNFLVKYASNCKYSFHGREINYEMSLITKLRLYILGVDYEIINKDVFLDNQEPKYDKIFTNFPLGMRLESKIIEILNSKEHNKKVPFNFSNKISSDWAFVSLALNYINSTGKIVAIMSNGSLYKMTDIDYRKKLVELGFVEAVISLPEKVFGYSNMACTLLILSNNNEKIKFIDAKDLYIAQRRVNELRIDDILTEYLSLNDTNISSHVDKKLLNGTDYNLTPSRYIKSNNIDLINPVVLETVIEDMFRGYQITAEEMDDLVVDSNEKNAYKILNLSNINNNIIDYNLEAIKPNNNKMDKYLLQDGDVIVSAKSSKIKIAVVEIKNNEKILVSGNLLVIRPNKEKINPVYLKMFFESSKGNKILSSIQTGGVILSINPSQLKKINISLLDIDKQNKLASKYLAKLDSIQIARLKLRQLEEELGDIGIEEI